MHQDLKTRLSSGEPLLGTMLTMPSATTAEVLAEVGFDWFFIDGEHGPLGSAEILGILQAVGDRVPCLIRIPEAAEVPIKQALDLGAQGIIVPQITSAQQVRDVVRWSKYPPAGTRGVGLARAHRYGAGFQPYVDCANDQTIVVIQVEHRLAVDDIDAIVSTDGIDCVFLGPYDLSASMGLMGQVDHPQVLAAIERTCQAAQDAGISIGSFAVTGKAIQADKARGITLLCGGTDTTLLGSGAKAMLSAIREETT